MQYEQRLKENEARFEELTRQMADPVVISEVLGTMGALASKGK